MMLACANAGVSKTTNATAAMPTARLPLRVRRTIRGRRLPDPTGRPSSRDAWVARIREVFRITSPSGRLSQQMVDSQGPELRCALRVTNITDCTVSMAQPRGVQHVRLRQFSETAPDPVRRAHRPRVRDAGSSFCLHGAAFPGPSLSRCPRCRLARDGPALLEAVFADETFGARAMAGPGVSVRDRKEQLHTLIPALGMSQPRRQVMEGPIATSLPENPGATGVRSSNHHTKERPLSPVPATILARSRNCTRTANVRSTRAAPLALSQGARSDAGRGPCICTPARPGGEMRALGPESRGAPAPPGLRRGAPCSFPHPGTQCGNQASGSLTKRRTWAGRRSAAMSAIVVRSSTLRMLARRAIQTSWSLLAAPS